MKRIYHRLKMSALPFYVAKVFLASAIAILASFYSATAQELVFKDPILVSGMAGQDNAVYLFSKVNQNIDALVQVKMRSASDVIIGEIDMNGLGWEKAFQPQVGINGGVVSDVRDWWVEFEISFVKTETSNPADVNEFSLTTIDVDGDGLTIQEYIELYDAASYYCEAGTQLQSTSLTNDDEVESNNKSYRVLGPIQNYLDIDTMSTQVMVTGTFINKNKIKVRVGAQSVGLGTSNAALRYNSIWFRSFSYTVATFLPVKLTSFTANTINSNKILLNWNTAQEKNSSHFTIEKSLNGKDFADAGIVFTMGDSEIPQQYSFTDELRTDQKGMIYYRLKIVNLDGGIQYSSIKVVRLEEKPNVSILVYPNPVANDLRVTLPSTWQDKKVIIDIYTINGVLVKKFISNTASQTETINVRALNPGSYIIRSTNNVETTSHYIIKSN